MDNTQSQLQSQSQRQSDEDDNNYEDKSLETPGDRTMAKKDSLSIVGILDRIKKLKIPDKDKVAILNAFRKGIRNPSLGENVELDKIQSKYSKGPQSQPMQIPIHESSHESNRDVNHETAFMHGMPQFNPMQIPNEKSKLQQHYQIPHYQIPHYQIPQYGYPNFAQQGYPQGPQQVQPQNYMTIAHFDILKNKMDSLQFELVDLLRHVKDYTQRYMNSIRQSDLEKIDQYINGLFDVDKTLREAKEKAEGVGAPPEEAPATGIMGALTGANRNGNGFSNETPPQETQGSIISSATNGIKNFFSGIGNNLSGITSLVASTANVANNLLSKKIIGSDEKPILPPLKSTSTETSTNKNVMSVEEYISDMNKMNHNGMIPSLDKSPMMISSNMNKLNTTNPTTLSSLTSTANSANAKSANAKSAHANSIPISRSNNLNTKQTPKILDDDDVKADEDAADKDAADEDAADEDADVADGQSGSLNSAIGKLNRKIASDTHNKIVVSTSENEKNTVPREPISVTSNLSNMSGGGNRRIASLSERVKLLKLKLTQRNLQEKLNKRIGGSRGHIDHIGIQGDRSKHIRTQLKTNLKRFTKKK